MEFKVGDKVRMRSPSGMFAEWSLISVGKVVYIERWASVFWPICVEWGHMMRQNHSPDELMLAKDGLDRAIERI